VREVAKRLGFERTWLVRLPAGVKDVNEFLVHGGTREQFAALKKVSKGGRELRTADQEGTCSTVCKPKVQLSADTDNFYDVRHTVNKEAV